VTPVSGTASSWMPAAVPRATASISSRVSHNEMLMSLPVFVVGEQVEAGKPWPLLGTGDLVLGEADNLVEPFSSCLGRDQRARTSLSYPSGFCQSRRWTAKRRRLPRWSPPCSAGPARIAIRLRAVLHGPGVPWDTEAV
jgi:hypothetical protein